MHVYWSRLWMSAVICPVAFYLIWLCIKFQFSEELTIQTVVRFQNKCFSPEIPRSATTESLPRRLMKGSGRRSRTAAGTQHPKISLWFAVKTCISDAACCSQIIPHCPTPTHPHLPKGEQAWTGRDEYQLNGSRYLNCFSLLTAPHAAL